MLDKTRPHNDSFLAKWMKLSTMGWFVGISSTLLLRSLYDEFDFYLYEFPPVLDGLLFFVSLLPIGLSVGSLQSLLLKQWNVKTGSWIGATTFGWWFPATTILFYLREYYFHPDPSGVWMPLIISGAVLGACQAFVIRKVVSRPVLWIFTNVLGVCALVYLLSHLFPNHDIESAPSLYEKLIYIFFDDWDQRILVHSIYDQIFGVFFLPLFGVLTTALPTGILLKYFIPTESMSNASSKPPIAG